MTRGESKTSVRRLRAIDRQVRALELRRSGITFARIATMLGYAGRQGAQRAISKALARTANPAAYAHELRLDLERVDSLFVRPFQAALAGDLEAVAACLAIMAYKARLLGLDAPVRPTAIVRSRPTLVITDEEVAAAATATDVLW